MPPEKNRKFRKKLIEIVFSCFKKSNHFILFRVKIQEKEFLEKKTDFLIVCLTRNNKLVSNVQDFPADNLFLSFFVLSQIAF